MVTDPPEHNSQLTSIALGDYPCSFAKWYWDVVNPESILVPAAFIGIHPVYNLTIASDRRSWRVLCTKCGTYFFSCLHLS